LQESGSEPYDVANMDRSFRPASRGNIFAEGSWLREQRMFADLAAPSRVVIARIVMNGLFRPTMVFKIRLRVANQADTRDLPRPGCSDFGNPAGVTFGPKRMDAATQNGNSDWGKHCEMLLSGGLAKTINRPMGRHWTGMS
jgi:hypothetical protein